MADELVPTPPTGQFLIYADGGLNLQVRLDGQTVWLTQRLISELFQISVKTANEHLVNIYDEGELDPAATIRKYRIVQTEGSREVSRLVDHYNLDAILAVGYRVRSHVGTAFRQWATARLSELLVKGFTLDDERLKKAGGGDHFQELLDRICRSLKLEGRSENEERYSSSNFRVFKANRTALPGDGREARHRSHVGEAIDSIGYVHRGECGGRPSQPERGRFCFEVLDCLQGSTRNPLLAPAYRGNGTRRSGSFATAVARVPRTHRDSHEHHQETPIQSGLVSLLSNFKLLPSNFISPAPKPKRATGRKKKDGGE